MSHAAQAYARTSQATASPREIEAQALLMAARKLQDVQTNWTGPDQNMHKALLFNRRLWTIFMSAAETNDNPQPLEVRQNIANIGVFVMQQTIEMQIESGSGETEIADRHQLQYRGGSRRQGLRTGATVASLERQRSGLAVGGERPRGRFLGQIERAEIGAAAQHRFVGKLLDHLVGLLIDDLIDDRGRGAIEERLMRYVIARNACESLRAPALASGP